MSTKKRVLFSILLGLSIIGLFFYFRYFSKQYFEERSDILYHLDRFQTLETVLQYDVLETSFFLYKNFDKIVQTAKEIESQQVEFEQDHLPHLPQLLKRDYLAYKKISQKVRSTIFDFETVNSTIKNSLALLTTLMNKIPDFETTYPHFNRYEKTVISAIANVILAKSSFDKDFLQEIQKDYVKLQKYHFSNQKLQRFHVVLLAHLNIFLQNFPTYTKYLNTILQKLPQNSLEAFRKDFEKVSHKKLQTITFLYAIFTTLFLFTIAYNIYLILLLDKENRELDRLARKDTLTGLYNRNSFFLEKEKYKHPALILINIDRFKHFNDIYGTEVGDCILKSVANTIKEHIKTIIPNAQLFRIGGDDFAILTEKDTMDLEKIACAITHLFQTKPIFCHNLEVFITVSIGISTSKPLLETADIALKEVKKNPQKTCLYYTSSQNLLNKVDTNLKMTNMLIDAIKNKNIIPFYQAIVDIRNNQKIKYEVLARIKTDRGVESIYPYLKLAKEIKLYKSITKMIFLQSFAMMSKKNIAFSLNISIDDIIDPDFTKMIDELFRLYPNLQDKITFEILESASIADYEIVKEFIKKVKRFGAKIAIDDFGSGYSNFEHLLNLQIDYIKIDGSLIKNIHKDKNAKLIVWMIVNFTQAADIKTVAEFVHSQEVYEAIKDIGIDYAQGFFLHKPSPTIDE
ncbi:MULTISPECIES: EAL domain-containing protein [unclassified Nitratiruptor]|uniref:EAL domain-containing protein n=1 Tax=unclassified Nitratiruptor TaxID=2624044 RepID=UPI001915A72C|nr:MULTISPECIES: EAL domain-containing protein [unclassified Nitratiruptor]BCD60938.1 diguanylate cyclase/phosphodiesterase [Nitratiruptor sp. YY08-10]BCD64870.1 diguanylate cyclase/phosphodiesterase [Nitratiruptor sp. YY08-14]